MLHQELLPAVALCPGKASWHTGGPCTSLSSSWISPAPRKVLSPLAFEGWLMGAALTAALLSPGAQPKPRTAQAAGGPIKTPCLRAALKGH